MNARRLPVAMLHTCLALFLPLFLTLCLLLALPRPSLAWDMQGTKVLSAHTRDQQRIELGTVRFERQEGGRTAFAIALDHKKFTDHFLSMKEFKCLGGPDEIFCHLPYPYRQPGTVGANDFAWLEHSLLFLFKLPREFGAKLLNGIYFRFEPSERGLIGKPQAIDLNHISAPPDKPELPPFNPATRSDIPPGARWIEYLSIE